MSLLRKAYRKARKITVNSALTFWARFWRIRGWGYQYLWSPQEVDSLIGSKTMFFIHGSGRSGTQMLSGLLSLDTSAAVLHEPALFEDRTTRNAAREDLDSAVEYISRFRKYLIYKKLKECTSDVLSYGEVTGTLRYHAEALYQLYPDALTLILARDGRDVVRSIMQRDFYTRTSVKAGDTSPLPGTEYFDRWEGMTRFEKVCWAWADAHRELLRALPAARVIHFEKIIKDYDYCEREIFSYLGIKLDYETWHAYVSRKSPNATQTHNFDHWKKWNKAQRDAFDDICGQVMKRLGYEYKWK